MIIKVFGYPTDNGNFQDEFLLSTNQFVSYEYTKKWVGTGNFTLVLPLTKDFLKIVENCILYIDGDWLFVNNVKYDEKQIEVSGTDLNGFLDLRITAFGKTQVSGADGYDVVKGTTGECINHYINNNAVNPEDSNRKIPRLVIGQTAKGKDSDSYMARLKMLSEVVGNLCLNATIGYEIVADLDNNRFVFNTLTGTDRSIEQTDNNYVILSQKRNNLYSATYERGNEDLLNAIYATGADVTQTVYRDNNTPSGILRRECAVDVSVESVSDIKDYALNEVSGNIANNSYELDIAAVKDYGKEYKLGDYVTVKDSTTGNTWTAQIVEATKTYSATEKKIKLTLGDAKTKLLNKIQNTVTLNSISNANEKKNTLQSAISNATQLITGTEGGHLLIHLDENQKPYELLIMDTEDIQTAQKIWRFDLGGIGYSSTGYNGTFGTAMTMDGQIVADFITAGTLQGITIIADNGSVGGWTIDSGKLVSADKSIRLDSNNNQIGIYMGNTLFAKLSTLGLILYDGNGNQLSSISRQTMLSGEKGLTINITDNANFISFGKWNADKNLYDSVLYYEAGKGFTLVGDVSVQGNLIVSGTINQ